MQREGLLVQTLVELADTLVDDFDVVDLLSMVADRCVEVLDVAAAGIMLVGPTDETLRAIASSSESMRIMEIFEQQSQEGPCPDCYRSGRPVVEEDLTTADARWPRFSPEARSEGFLAAYALPMHLRGKVIGALNLFHRKIGAMTDADIVAAQAFADVATIAILHYRSAREAQDLNDQLQGALNSRVIIEQAKGIVVEKGGLDMQQSFDLLRNHARRTNQRLVVVAENIIAKTLSLDDIVAEHGRQDAGSSPNVTSRNRTISDRERAIHARALRRDVDAERRDVAADKRDEQADERADTPGGATADRKSASIDRFTAARDRDSAAEDRHDLSQPPPRPSDTK